MKPKKENNKNTTTNKTLQLMNLTLHSGGAIRLSMDFEDNYFECNFKLFENKKTVIDKFEQLVGLLKTVK